MNAWTVFFAFLLGAHLTFAAAYADNGDRLEVIKSLAFAALTAAGMIVSVVAQ